MLGGRHLDLRSALVVGSHEGSIFQFERHQHGHKALNEVGVVAHRVVCREHHERVVGRLPRRTHKGRDAHFKAHVRGVQEAATSTALAQLPSIGALHPPIASEERGKLRQLSAQVVRCHPARVMAPEAARVVGQLALCQLPPAAVAHWPVAVAAAAVFAVGTVRTRAVVRPLAAVVAHLVIVGVTGIRAEALGARVLAGVDRRRRRVRRRRWRRRRRWGWWSRVAVAVVVVALGQFALVMAGPITNPTL